MCRKPQDIKIPGWIWLFIFHKNGKKNDSIKILIYANLRLVFCLNCFKPKTISIDMNKGWKFLKKLWCCVGGGSKVIWLYQLSRNCKLATVTSKRADVSSVSPSSHDWQRIIYWSADLEKGVRKRWKGEWKEGVNLPLTPVSRISDYISKALFGKLWRQAHRGCCSIRIFLKLDEGRARMSYNTKKWIK